MKTAFNRFAKTTAVAAFTFFTMSAFAAPIEGSNYLVKQFEKQFRGASGVTWKTTSQFTSASFTQQGQKVSVFYNTEGDLVGISKVITVNDLPKKAQQKLSADYSNHVIVSVIEFTDADDATKYYVQLENNNKQSILQIDGFGSFSNFQ